METCPTCGGDGEILKYVPQRNDPEFCTAHQCPECGGRSGRISSADMPEVTEDDFEQIHGQCLFGINTSQEASMRIEQVLCPECKVARRIHTRADTRATKCNYCVGKGFVYQEVKAESGETKKPLTTEK